MRAGGFAQVRKARRKKGVARCRACSLRLGRGERNLKEMEGFVTEDGEEVKLGCWGVDSC